LIHLVLATFLFPIVGIFWVFVLWMLWIISKSLKGIDETLKELARSQQSKS
jgi:hypothetical protein